MQERQNRFFTKEEIECKIDYTQKELKKALEVNPDSRYTKRLITSLQNWQNNYKETLKRN